MLRNKTLAHKMLLLQIKIRPLMGLLQDGRETVPIRTSFMANFIPLLARHSNTLQRLAVRDVCFMFVFVERTPRETLKLLIGF